MRPSPRSRLLEIVQAANASRDIAPHADFAVRVGQEQLILGHFTREVAKWRRCAVATEIKGLDGVHREHQSARGAVKGQCTNGAGHLGGIRSATAELHRNGAERSPTLRIAASDSCGKRAKRSTSSAFGPATSTPTSQAARSHLPIPSDGATTPFVSSRIMSIPGQLSFRSCGSQRQPCHGRSASNDPGRNP